MLFESVKITGVAVGQIFILAAVGYFLVKKGIFNEKGLDALSRLVIEVTLTSLIFAKLVKEFSFRLYPTWWVFPILSLAITVAGLLLGYLFLVFIKGRQQKLQFLSLVAFQNSGYLPLALIAALLPPEKATPMFVYLFLLLLGFNLVIWSFGAYLLSFHENRKFELGSLFSPPLIAILFSLSFVFFNLGRFLPDIVLKTLRMIGDCTLPLAMFVVGGSLALIRIGQVDKKAISLILLLKLIILPLAGLFLIIKFNLPDLLGLLILIELAMPPATSLAIIIRHYKKEDLLISQGIFFGHIFSLITLPIFLSLYFMLVMIE